MSVSKTKSYMDIDASDQIVSLDFVATPTAHNEHSLPVQDTFVFSPDFGQNNFDPHRDVIHINHSEFANVDATSTTYTYTTIVPPGSGYTIASSINDKEQIVGLYQDSNGEHGFLYDHGTYTTIDPPGSFETVAEAINNKGQIIGFWFDRTGPQQGFLEDHGTYTTIDPPDSLRTEPESINDKGQIVGVYFDDNAHSHGFLYSGGNYIVLDAPAATDTTAVSINNKGQIVGFYFDSISHQHGFLDDHGTYTTIDPPSSVYTTITDINAKGELVGYFQEHIGGPEQGFLYSGGAYTTIDFPGADRTLADGINNKGQIVGVYVDNTGQHGFVDDDGAYTTIDVNTAASINDKGQIVGFFVSGTNEGFLATPEHGSNASLVHLNGDFLLAADVGHAVTGAASGHAADTFVFAPNFGENTITDFNFHNDTLELPKSEFADLAAVMADAHQNGADTIIAHDAHDIITLHNVSLSQLHDSHIWLV